MKTIVEALQNLYVALGGKASDVADLVLNPDVIEEIAKIAGDAVKPELPALTGNAGKVLKVDADADGVEWGEAGGGGGILFVTFSYDSENEAWTADKTGAEIWEVIDNGGVVYANIYGDENITYIPMTYSYSEDEYFEYYFGKTDISDDGYFSTLYYNIKIRYTNNGVEVNGMDTVGSLHMIPAYVLYASSAEYNFSSDQFTPTSIVLDLGEGEGPVWIPGVTRIQYSKNNGAYYFDVLVVSVLSDSYRTQIALATISNTGGYTKLNKYEYNPSTHTLSILDIPSE